MIPSRALFFDVDGVLNTTACWGKSLGESGDYSNRLDPVLVARAAALVRELDACCVLSSTWRVAAGYERTMAALEKAGWSDARARFVGATPFASCSRGLEIGAWLHANPIVTSFAILDDGSDMAGHSRRLVRTNPAVGLSEACCALVREMVI